jgi:divalent metal cation (Fe/Co/Zn/Cd) transporter
LIVGSVINFIQHHKPDSTLAGIIISSVSIVSMYFLMKIKLRTGKSLNSEAIIADANCTKTCFILSIILLASSLGYELLHIGYIDILGSLGIAYYAFREGKEAFEKASNNRISCSCDDCHYEK